MIYIEPYGGLANRMRVIASSKDIFPRKKMKLIWNENSELNCPFNELFEPILNIDLIHRPWWSKKMIHIPRSNFKNHLFVLLKQALRYVRISDDEIVKIKAKNKILTDTGLLHINTCLELSKGREVYKIFKPKVGLLKRVDEAFNGMLDSCIGIHIRRTDNAKSIKESPLELFDNAIQNELEINSNSKFYLATDDKAVENYFCSKYGDLILCLDKELTRNTKNGIQDALVEMICLSRTKKILGSYYSSFSEVASYLGGIPLVVIKNS